MANATILSIGGVTVSTAGGLTGDLLQSVINTITNTSAETTTLPGGTADPTIPAPTQSAVPNVLVIPSDDTGTISIPAGYDYVIYEGTGSIVGGDANTVIIGSDLTYTGPAGTVLGTGGTENITDSTAGANFAFYTGSYTLNAGGANDTIMIDSGASGNTTVSGDNASIVLGTPSNSGGGASAAGALAAALGAASAPGVNIITITGTNETTSVAGGSNLIFLTGTDDITASGGSTTVVTGQGGIVTLNATGGSQVVFDNAGGNVINGGPSTEFVGAPGGAENTYTGAAGGADTVFAVSSINYEGALSASTLFLGGAGAATVFAGTHATLFGGSGSGVYHEGTGAGGSFFFWGGDHGASSVAGSDTVLGAASSPAVFVWGDNNENTTVSQLGAATGGIYVAWGEADTLNAMNASGGNSFIVVDESLPGGANFSGNTTLVGSTAGHDTFAFFAETSTTAHTITISNWQASDTLSLNQFSDADSAAATAALAAAGGSNATFTLSDNTTIKFVGSSPTSHT